MEGGFPFQIRQPHYNQETELAMLEAKKIMNGTENGYKYATVPELFADLDED